MIYILLFSFLLLLSLFELYTYEKKVVFIPRINTEIFFYLALIILAGGRLNSGFDYAGYEQYYHMIKEGTLPIFNNIVEPGYVILNIITPSYRVLLFIISIGCVGIKYFAFKQLNVRLHFFVLLIYFATFYLTYDMGVIRQGLSMGICLLSIRYASIKDKRFFILIIIATLFHVSAIIYVFLYFLSDKEFKRVTYYSILGIAILLPYVFSNGFLKSGFVKEFIEIIGGEYIIHKVNAYYSTLNIDYSITIIKRVFIGVVFIEWFKRQQKKQRKKETFVWIMINGYVLSIPIFSALSSLGFGQIAGRIVTPLYMLYFLIYERIIRTRYNRFIRIGLFFLFIVLSYATLHETIYNSTGNVYRDYNFFIQSTQRL